MRDDAVANLTQLIGGAQELHAYSVRCLYRALAQDISQVASHHPSSGLPNPSSPSWATYSLYLVPNCFSLKVIASYLVEETLKDRALFLVRTPQLLSWLWYLLAV